MSILEKKEQISSEENVSEEEEHEEEEEEDGEVEEEAEPVLKYSRVTGSLTKIFQENLATALAVSDKFLVGANVVLTFLGDGDRHWIAFYYGRRR
jgi:hypothetical protein